MTANKETASRTWETFLHILYVTGALLLLTIAGFTYLNFRAYLENQGWVTHTNQVLYQAEKELSLLKDAETGTRGYLISGDSLYLQPYRHSLDSVDGHLRQLEHLTRDNSSQQRRLALLRPVVGQTLEHLRQLIQLKNAHRSAQLEHLFLLRIGKQRMDQVRMLLQTLMQEERRLLAIRHQKQQASADRTRLSTYLIIAASLLIDVMLVVTLRRGLRQRVTYQQALAEKNRALAQTNEELAATIEDLQQAQNRLAQVNEGLEQRVSQRTLALSKTNEELDRTNQELVRINNDLDNFVYTASHDLKAPIANMEGLTAVLSKRLGGRLDEKETQMLAMLQAMTNRLQDTIADLSEISRVQKERDQPAEPLLFHQVLEDVLADLQPLLEDSRATITTHWQEQEIRYGRKHLRSVLYNLVGNALKYRSPDRPLAIEVRTYRQAEQLVLSVADNGLGIPAGQLPRLFGMFKRFHAHVEGTGIGLYITKRIVENHGGRIEVESQEGKGTRFVVYFLQ